MNKEMSNAEKFIRSIHLDETVMTNEQISILKEKEAVENALDVSIVDHTGYTWNDDDVLWQIQGTKPYMLKCEDDGFVWIVLSKLLYGNHESHFRKTIWEEYDGALYELSREKIGYRWVWVDREIPNHEQFLHIIDYGGFIALEGGHTIPNTFQL